MATNSGGWLYEANGTPVDKATADNAQARVLEIKQSADTASTDAAKALQAANAYAGQIAQANTTAGRAEAIAQGAEDTVERYSEDVEGLKVNAGWNAGSPNDAQNAAFLRDPASESHAVLNAQTADVADARIEWATYPPPVDRFYSGLYRQALPKFSAAVDAVLSGERDAKVLCIGDSTTYGQGAPSPVYRHAWPAIMAEELNRTAIRTTCGFAVPPQTGFADPRWTLGAGWVTTSQDIGFCGYLGRHFGGNPNSGPLFFTDPDVVWDTMDIYYMEYGSAPGSGAKLRAQATGGEFVSMDTANGLGTGKAASKIGKVTVTAAAASASNTVTIWNTEPTITSRLYITAVDYYLAGTRQVRIANAAASGTNTHSWLREFSATTDWSSRGAIRAYDPDLIIIDLGINDSGSTVDSTPEVYATNLANIVAAAPNADVIYKTFIPSGQSYRWPRQAEYVEVMRSKGAWIDFNTRYESYAKTSERGWMVDDLHGNADLYHEEGVAFAAALRELVRR